MLENKKIMKRKTYEKCKFGANKAHARKTQPRLLLPRCVTPTPCILFFSLGTWHRGKPKLTRQNFKRFDGGVCVGVLLSLLVCVWVYYSLSVCKGVQLYLFDALQLQQFPFPAAAALLHLLHRSFRLHFFFCFVFIFT